MLEVNDVHFSYSARSRPVLNGVTFELNRGEVGILMGVNGAGKTTLFKAVLGSINLSKGVITLDGESLPGMNKRRRARIIAYVPQDIQFGELSVFDTVMMGRIAYFGLRPSKADYEAVERVLSEMNLTEYAGYNVTQLSGGERQKTAIARALVQDPGLLIFDEPTGNLDISNEQLILSEASRLAHSRNIAVLSSLHDLNQAFHFGDKFYFLKDGIIKYQGGKEGFTEDVIEDIFGVRRRRIAYKGEEFIVG